MEASVLQQAAEAYAQYGWLGLLGIILTGLIGIYKTPTLQNMLPEKARWESWDPLLRMALVFVFAFLGFGLLTFAATHSWLAAIGAGIQSALVAMGGKAVVDSIKPKPPSLPPQTPGVDRESISIRTPVPRVNL